MIIITGAAGFIGSCMVRKLNDQGHMNLLVVDDFSREDKNRNLAGKNYIARVHRDDLFSWIDRMHQSIEFIFHLGARTDTTEKDTAIFDRLNLHYSQEVWKRCAQYGIPLVYASSAATYGLGELGYDDRHDIVDRLRPLNPYGVSKNDFDIWALEQEKTPPFWAGLKFFNVYGPNEYHKGRMASVIFHTVRQIKATGGMKLFRSHRPDYGDGAQSRDFIFVKDVLDIQYFLYENRRHSGLYNVGTGKARTFLDLATNTFLAMGLAPNISFIDTPEDIRDTYQYFTEANMEKLRGIGYDQPFHSLEDGIREYVQHYLLEEKIY
ncbi:MAG: ADP-glyceromanno-heptose 6-epimerase [Haliscomenobacter sp.]|nr:ADP-glyceromanno-heptose 6-epimerase [Haliscomenobacter sp.]MBK8877067.1 ADP-glyceromanno-heptose 6-epimerase [Haliscomenobacter sp.]